MNVLNKNATINYGLVRNGLYNPFNYINITSNKIYILGSLFVLLLAFIKLGNIY